MAKTPDRARPKPDKPKAGGRWYRDAKTGKLNGSPSRAKGTPAPKSKEAQDE